MEYDFQGRMTKQSDPVDDVTYTYTASGEISTVTDGLSHTTDYDYDENMRLTKVNYANGKATVYQYDGAGRVTKTGAGASGRRIDRSAEQGPVYQRREHVRRRLFL